MDLRWVEKGREDFANLLNVCKMAHRKHCQGDDSIGWEELADELNSTLANVMGDEKYCEWLDKGE